LSSGINISGRNTFNPDETATLRLTTSSKEPFLGLPIQFAIFPAAVADACFTTPQVYLDNVRLTAIPALVGIALNARIGLWGVPKQKTARLHALCEGSTPCQGALEFHDIHGVLLSQSRLSLAPGASTFLDLSTDQRPGNPVEVIPSLFLTGGTASTSFEIFDTSSLRTEQFIDWGDGTVARSGQLDFGPAGIARGETARLKAFCVLVNPGPCDAAFVFQDRNGRLLKQTRKTLSPGTGAFLDLAFEETGSSDRRAEIRASLNVSGAPAVGSLAILDSEAGLTIAQAYPAAPASVGR
jgi:hypothetical protein